MRPRALAAPIVGLACLHGLLACSISVTKHPPPVGGCIPVDDAGCANPAGGGLGSAGLEGGSGSQGGSSSGGSSGGGSSSGSMVGCGGADLLVMTQNRYCTTCITGNCCSAALPCTGSCQQLLQCAQLCVQGATDCIGICENMYTPQALTAYQGFASCVSQNCAFPMCPNLQQ